MLKFVSAMAEVLSWI